MQIHWSQKVRDTKVFEEKKIVHLRSLCLVKSAMKTLVPSTYMTSVQILFWVIVLFNSKNICVCKRLPDMGDPCRWDNSKLRWNFYQGP